VRLGRKLEPPRLHSQTGVWERAQKGVHRLEVQGGGIKKGMRLIKDVETGLGMNEEVSRRYTTLMKGFFFKAGRIMMKNRYC
jgi:hypothetical protein